MSSLSPIKVSLSLRMKLICILFTIFAFYTTLRIRFIPWTAIDIDKSDDNGYFVDVKQLPTGSVGIIAKFMLRITGFNFHVGKISKEELDCYCRKALSSK